MNYEELLELLGISEPEEFEYFENLADLMESEEYLEEEALGRLFSGVRSGLLARLTEDYFADILEHTPDSEADFVSMLRAVGESLAALAGEIAPENDRSVVFAEELNRFRKWYIFENDAVCRDRENGSEELLSIADALADYRAEAFSGEEKEYDFDACLNYPLSEYVVPIGGVYGSGAEPDEAFERDEEEHGHPHIHRQEGELYGHASHEILQDGFVYDDEMKEDF